MTLDNWQLLWLTEVTLSKIERLQEKCSELVDFRERMYNYQYSLQFIYCHTSRSWLSHAYTSRLSLTVFFSVSMVPINIAPEWDCLNSKGVFAWRRAAELSPMGVLSEYLRAEFSLLEGQLLVRDLTTAAKF